MESPELNEALEVSGSDVESWRLKLPAKGACYLLEEAGGAPVLLSTCADLRAAVVNRMTGVGSDDDQNTGGQAASGTQPDEPQRRTKRIDYAAVVRRVRWRAACSKLESDWCYLENARRLYPDTYRALTKRWRCFWIEADVEGPYPRFTTTDTPSVRPERCFGPLPDAGSAKRIVEALEDIFDLCRYHNILLQSPLGQACAYKQMGRCPAPCDGSIPMEEYRRRVCEAFEFLKSPRARWVEKKRDEMSRAAGLRDFENANRVKQVLERARALEARGAELLAPMSGFRWVLVRRGSRKRAVRVFLVTPRGIEVVEELGKKDWGVGLAWLAERAATVNASGGVTDAELMGVVAWHLFHPEGAGVNLKMDESCAEALRSAAERVWT